LTNLDLMLGFVFNGYPVITSKINMFKDPFLNSISKSKNIMAQVSYLSIAYLVCPNRKRVLGRILFGKAKEV